MAAGVSVTGLANSEAAGVVTAAVAVATEVADATTRAVTAVATEATNVSGSHCPLPLHTK